jgi:3-phenylpropionate/cinnamic acid dioxygenase small subunit
MSDAHEQIRNLLGTYCERMDSGDFAGLAELFADARLADEHGTVFATGSAEVLAMWQAQTILHPVPGRAEHDVPGRAEHDVPGRAEHDVPGRAEHDGSPGTRHVTANPVIEVDGDIARCRSSYVVFQGVDDFGLQPIASGRYADTFTRDDEGSWRWSERRYALDHVGDLSHHLRG